MPSVKLSPLFNDEQLDNNGLPLSGGLVYWYLAGTTTPITVYAESSGSVPNTNPVVLNTRGEPANPIWLPTGQAYKAVLKDSVGNIIRTVDNISGINDTSAPTISEWLLYAGPATYINATQFSVTGDATAIFDNGRRIKATVSGTDRYATVSGSPVYGAGVTTVTLSLDSGVLDASLNTVYYGFLDPAYPSFSVKPSELSTPNALYWDIYGNIGIGNTVPASIAKLSVSNQITTDNNRLGVAASTYLSGPTYTATFIQQGDSATAGTTCGLSNVNLGALLFQNTSAALLWTNNDVPVVFGNAAAEKMRIAVGGNVGIGTASPGQKLSVAGTIESTSGGIKFPDGTTQATAPTQIGVGQTWQAFTVSGGSPQRASGATYTNSSGKPIQVCVALPDSGGSATVTVVVNAVTVYSVTYDAGSAFGSHVTNFIVPNGQSYSVTAGGTATISSWSELR